MSRSATATALLVMAAEATNVTFVLPLLMFYPTSRCNSRCVSCDWWKSSGASDLRLEEIARLADALPPLGTELVVFSGGEPLLRPDVFDAAALFRTRGVKLHLLTSGILLDRCATDVAAHFERVTISLDAHDDAGYHAIRGVAGLRSVQNGVARLRKIAPQLPITARSTLHRLNFRELPRLVDCARAMRLERISFLAADVSSTAFGRERATDQTMLALSDEEVDEFTAIVEETIRTRQHDFASGFIAESPDKLRRLPRYYAALGGRGVFPGVACNAPWTSVVVEADGSVRPCFFHDRIGNIRDTPLAMIVARELPAFRRTLDLRTNPVCTRCVCSLKTGWRSAPWS